MSVFLVAGIFLICTTFCTDEFFQLEISIVILLSVAKVHDFKDICIKYQPKNTTENL